MSGRLGSRRNNVRLIDKDETLLGRFRLLASGHTTAAAPDKRDTQLFYGRRRPLSIVLRHELHQFDVKSDSQRDRLPCTGKILGRQVPYRYPLVVQHRAQPPHAYMRDEFTFWPKSSSSCGEIGISCAVGSGTFLPFVEGACSVEGRLPCPAAEHDFEETARRLVASSSFPGDGTAWRTVPRMRTIAPRPGSVEIAVPCLIV
jgi:hypothetical protein